MHSDNETKSNGKQGGPKRCHLLRRGVVLCVMWGPQEAETRAERVSGCEQRESHLPTVPFMGCITINPHFLTHRNCCGSTT